jgi:DNA-binding NtrC family response regulator
VRDEDNEIIGSAPALLAALALARRVAPARVPVLVNGESGTGKELVARLLHRHGPTPRGPLVAVNCGTLPRELADSELFGHERGAFTGAGARKKGWFEEAHGGTLVLDEIGELALELQPKLLRVLETGRLRRVGGTGELGVDVRVVALTLRDLRQDVEGRRFRLDLFHRLAGVEVTLPPLRRRRSDIPRLVQRFLDELAPELGPRTIEARALEALVRRDWPGNVRELRNIIRRAAILSTAVIGVADLACGNTPGTGAFASEPPTGTGDVPELTGGTRLADGDPAPDGEWPRRAVARPDDELASTRGAERGGEPPGDLLCLTGRRFDDIERAVLSWALARHGGSRRRAARALGMPRSTFCDKVRRFGTTP